MEMEKLPLLHMQWYITQTQYAHCTSIVLKNHYQTDFVTQLIGQNINSIYCKQAIQFALITETFSHSTVCRARSFCGHFRVSAIQRGIHILCKAA